MSAAFIWIIFPLLASAGLYLFRRWEKSIHLAGLLIAILLAILALVLPIEQAIPIRIWSQIPPIYIKGSIPWLGARLTVEENTRPMLVLLYLASASWFGGAYASRVNRLLIPLGLGVAGLLSAAFSITPDIYANLLVVLAAILCIPIFSPPGRPIQRGARRFLTFQTLGMGLIALANLSILLATIQADLQIDLRVPVFVLGLGYGLVLPIFPFHTWVSMNAGAEKSEPYSSTYILFIIPAANAYLILATMLRMDIGAIFPNIMGVLQTMAVLLIFLGSVWAALENRLGKMIGFVVLHQIGTALLALSVETGSSPILDAPLNASLKGLFFAHFLPSGVALAVLALSLSVLQNQLPRANQEADLQIQDLSAAESGANALVLRKYPFASTGLLISLFSLAGMPLLASFPIYLPLWTHLGRVSIPLTAINLVGSGFLFLSAVRILNALLDAGEGNTFEIAKPDPPSETRLQAFLLSVGVLSILVLGLIPNLYLPYLARIALSVTNPIP